MMRKMERVLAMALCLTIGMTLFPFRSFAETDIPAGDEIVNVAAETEAAAEGRLFEVPPETLPETVLEEEPERVPKEETPSQDQEQTEKPVHAEEKEPEEVSGGADTVREETSEDPAVTPDIIETQEKAETESELIPEKENEADLPVDNTLAGEYSEAEADPALGMDPTEENGSGETEEEVAAEPLETVPDQDAEAALFDYPDVPSDVTMTARIGTTVTLEVVLDWLDDPSRIRYSWRNCNTGETLDETSNKVMVPVSSSFEHYTCTFSDLMPETVSIEFYIDGRVFLTTDDLTELTIREIGLNETGSASIETEGEPAYFSYSCSESGKYEIVTSPLVARTEFGYFSPDDGSFMGLSSTVGRQAGDKLISVYQLDAGTRYYAALYFDPDDTDVLTGDVTLQISKAVSMADRATPITVGESVTAVLAAQGDEAYYSFTAEESGPYALIPDMIGTGRDDISATIRVYDEYENILSYSSEVILDAGTTCYFAVCLESGSDASIPLTLVASNQLSVTASPSMSYVHTSAEVNLYTNVTAIDYSEIRYTWTKEGSDQVIGTEDSLTVLSASSEGITDVYLCTVSDQYGNSEIARFSVVTVAFESIGDGSVFTVDYLVKLPKDSGTDKAFGLRCFFKPNETGCYEFTADFSDGTAQGTVDASQPTVFGESILGWKRIYDGEAEFPDKGIVREVLQAGTEYCFEIANETGTPLTFSTRVFPADACGEEATWVYSDRTLNISGTGSVWYYAGTDYAWRDYTDAITRIVIEEGITETPFLYNSYHYLDLYSQVSEIDLPASLVKLYAYIDGSGSNSDNLTLRYAGTKAQWAAVDKSECTLTDVTVLCSDGEADEEVTWAFDEATGTLTFSGNGRMESHNTDEYPWSNIKDQIKRIVIEPGVTNIPVNAFYGCGSLTEVEIPEGVTTIENAFVDCISLEEIHIPSSVKSIDNWAFMRCSSLKRITVDTSNTIYKDIDGVLFSKDGEILICFPAGKSETYAIPSNVTKIGDYAFDECYILRNVEIPSSVTSIGDHAFSECHLSSLTIPDSVTSIGEDAFWGNDMPIVEIPASVSYIGEGAFAGCDKMTRITVQSGNSAYTDVDGVLYLQNLETLMQCPGGKTEISIPSGVKYIADSSFYGCNLTRVEFPEGTISIGNHAFAYCRVTEVTIPTSVTSIKTAAFIATSVVTVHYSGTEEEWNEIQVDENNDGLLNATILFGEELGELTLEAVGGETVFTVAYGETQELRVTATPSRPSDQLSYSWTYTTDWTESGEPETAALAEIGSSIETEAIKRPYRYVCTVTDQRGKTASVEFSVDYSRPDGFVGNGITWSFDGSTLTLSGVGEVWDYYPNSGFLPPWAGAADQITGIDLNEGITVIGKSAFHGLVNVERVNIPVTVIKIGNDAFSGCEGLRNGRVRYAGLQEQWDKIEIGSGNEMLSEAEYYIEEGSCGDSLSWILKLNGELLISGTGNMWDYAAGEAPWYEYRGLVRSGILEDGAGSVGSNAFSDCVGMETASIPESVSAIGAGCFQNCIALKSAAIPSRVTDIPESAFQSCASLSEIVIPDQVLTVGSYAFADCESARTVSIGRSLGEIGENAFFGCSAVQEYLVAEDNPLYYTEDSGGVLFENLDEDDLKRLLVYPAGKTETFYEISGDVIEIADYAFCRCAFLKGVYISCMDAAISGNVFFECGALEYFTTDENTQDWAQYWSSNGILFRRDEEGGTILLSYPKGRGATSYEVPDDVTKIGAYAFFGCTELESVSLPAGLTEIGESAFRGSGLRELVLPESVTTIGVDAFNGCGLMESITLPENVSVGESAFYGCDNLETVYYAGSTALWESIRGTLGLEEARVFSSDGYDDSLWVSVSEPEPVLGGVVLKMESNAAVIYTLGQDRPGGKYLDYREDELEKNGILLDRAGTFSITARAVDEASGRYSDTVTVSITVERSGKPELAAENGSVAILTGAGTAADAEVYYTVDMGDEPTRQSYRYMAPVVLDKNIMLKAVVYEKGKAPSETEAKWFYAAEKQSGLTINTDTYSFRNRNAEVGLDVYQDVFKNSVLGRFFYDCYTPEYLCFGMSTTALLFKYGILQKDEYFDLSGGGSLYSASDPKRDDAGLMKQIQKYQISQFLLDRLPDNEVPGREMVYNGTTELNDAYLNVLAKACSGEEPMILILDKRHAVVPCRMEENRVYVYDCNYPGEEPYLTFTRGSNGAHSFTYSKRTYRSNLSYVLLSTLLEKLDGVQSGRVDVFAEAEEQIMLGMNSTLFTILDAGGKEYSGYSPVETAADMVTENTVIQLDRGTYTLVNRDPGLKDWTVSAADEREYYRVTVSDPNARVEIGEENGHLYVTVRADSQANVRVKAYNAAGMENELEFTAAYVKVFTNGDDTMQVESSVPVMRVNGMDAVLNGKSSVRDAYLGTVSQESGSGALKAYVSGPRPEIRTDIASLADGPCTMTVLASDTGDTAIICAAGYDDAGKMVLYRQAETVAGRNKYVFAIPGQAAEVRVFLLEKTGYTPLTEMLQIGRE